VANKITFVKSGSTNLLAYVDGQFLANVTLSRRPKCPTGRPAYISHEIKLRGDYHHATDRAGLRKKIAEALGH
jgi:hypothetical protein